jgi:myo-inositol 2-dehydrogenase/D-chiro-inositol 1-dehydrogenase
VSELRIGVLGTGRIGSMHAELIARRVSGARLARIFDVDRDAAGVAAGLSVPISETAEELIGASDVDAVAICTSTDTHVAMIEAAAAAGKPIFCEKPVSFELGLVDRALAAVEQAGVPLMIGFNRRFDPAHASVRDAVAAGRIGDVHLVRITSRDPAPPPIAYIRLSGGIFLDMTIHDFDMARFITGSEVVEVFARGAARISSEIGEAGDLDTAVVTLVHADGTLTVIDNSRRAAYGFDQRVEAFGSKGVAASENPLAHTGVARTADGTTRPSLPHFFLERYLPSYIREWEAFVDAVSNRSPVPVGPADARAPIAIGLAASRSVREGRPVRVDEVG